MAVVHPPHVKPIGRQVRELITQPGEADKLISPDPLPIRKHEGILIQFPGFVSWYRRKHRVVRPIMVSDIVAYRKEKHEYESDVIYDIREIESRQVGRAVLAEIENRARMTLTIEPWTDDDEDNADAVADDRVAATSVGMPRLNTSGKPIKNCADKGGCSGTGKGSDVTIHFTPSMWGAGGSSGDSGPGSDTDEVLLHEMVHAGREMGGLLYFLPVSDSYENQEEFYAIVVTNIYLSEKNQKTFRANHNGHATLPDPDKFLDRKQVSPDVRTLLERLRLGQQSLFNALAGIDLTGKAKPFNPARQYDAERRPKAYRRSPFASGRSHKP